MLPQAEESSNPAEFFLLSPTDSHDKSDKRFCACLEEFKITGLVLLIDRYASTDLDKSSFSKEAGLLPAFLNVT